jgi:hypothetical protein
MNDAVPNQHRAAALPILPNAGVRMIKQNLPPVLAIIRLA